MLYKLDKILQRILYSLSNEILETVYIFSELAMIIMILLFYTFITYSIRNMFLTRKMFFLYKRAFNRKKVTFKLRF